jgi:histidinol-phosphate aminotransferase
MSEYVMPELYDGLRLHQNENTAGCSPRVMEALTMLRPEQLGAYPPYAAAVAQVAAYLKVAPERVALTNGLDEGIMALSVSCLRPKGDGVVPEAVLPEPAFEIFRLDTAVAGGRLVQLMPKADFAFPLDEVLAAINANTRAVFLTNPNNPTGVEMPLEAVRRIAARVPRDAIVFLDEAYAEFSRVTFIPELAAFPNVIVGRTFSKAFGLAGIRIGCLVGDPATLARITPAVPFYSVNIAAVVAVQAALADLAFVDAYVAQVAESKALLYAACDRLGLKYWPSSANFVLVRVGERVAEIVAGVRARGIFIRDRSTEPGCAGCIRMTTGRVADTMRCIAAIEEVL